MTPLFRKLNLKDQQRITVVNAPESFETELAALGSVTVGREVEAEELIGFALAFVTSQAEIDRLSRLLASRTPGDPVIWFAYPKQSSRRYSCDFNRDTGWTSLGEIGFEPVRQVAVDEDWSALRFRRIEHITRLARDPARAISADGKKRATADGPAGDRTTRKGCEGPSSICTAKRAGTIV